MDSSERNCRIIHLHQPLRALSKSMRSAAPIFRCRNSTHAILFFLRFLDPVLLYTSRGYVSYTGKLLMRWRFLSSDASIFFPAVLYFVTVYYAGKPVIQKNNIAWHMALILLNPCLILIDHGHFQMSAYFAPAFFSYLLGKCLRRQNPVIEVAKLGLAVVGTFAVVWYPYLYSPEAFLEVLSHLAPFERGIYEDYVANFWCTTSILIKWKRLFTTQHLKLLSLAATVSICLPSMIQLIWVPRKSSFLYGLLNCALAFYLFSFQIHEKSIMLPLLPASFLAMEKPFVFLWLTHNALVSMFPLLTRDKLVLPYVALYGLFVLLYYAPGGRQHQRNTNSAFATAKLLLLLCFLLLHVVYLRITPPRKYPFLFEAVIMLLCV